MKKSLLFMCLCGLLLSACTFDHLTINGGKMIEPSDNIVKREYPQKSFDQIEVNVIANVKYIQTSDDNCRVVLSAPDNYIDLFRFEVDSHELEVKFVRDNINISPAKVDVTIYSPTLTKIENDGVASIEITSLKGDKLEVENSGVGTMYLSGLNIGTIEADCSGVGNIELGGKANKACLDCSGVGSIRAENLEATTVVGDVSGVGGIRCHPVETLHATVSGVGSLQYSGEPQNKRLNRTGVGSITPL
jgi:hypothetical protein